MSKFNLTNIVSTILPSPSNIISAVTSNLPNALQSPILSFTTSATGSALPNPSITLSASIPPSASMLPSASKMLHIFNANSTIIPSSTPSANDLPSLVQSILPSPNSVVSAVVSNLPSHSALPSFSALPSASEALDVVTGNSTIVALPTSGVSNLPSLLAQSILASTSNIASAVVSNLPSLTISALPNTSDITDIVPSPSSLPSLTISALPSLSNLPDIVSNLTVTVPPVSLTNIPDLELPKENWISDDVFKGWLMVTTSGILILGCVGIVLGIITLICICKNNKHDYHQHPPYSISVVNSPPSEKIESGNKVNKLREIFTENSIGNSQLVSDPNHNNAANSELAADCDDFNGVL